MAKALKFEQTTAIIYYNTVLLTTSAKKIKYFPANLTNPLISQHPWSSQT